MRAAIATHSASCHRRGSPTPSSRRRTPRRLAPACPQVGTRARAFHDGRGDCALRARRRACPPRSWKGRSCLSAASCGREAPNASGAIRTCCAGCGEHRWRRCARRWNRRSRPRSRSSSPRGTASIGVRACGKRSCRCRRLHCRSRCGSRIFRPGASRTTVRSSSTSSARPARSSGSARVSIASPCISARTPACWGPIAGAPPPEGAVHDAIRTALARSAEFWSDLLASPRASRRSRRCPRSGISCGRAR